MPYTLSFSSNMELWQDDVGVETIFKFYSVYDFDTIARVYDTIRCE